MKTDCRDIKEEVMINPKTKTAETKRNASGGATEDKNSNQEIFTYKPNDSGARYDLMLLLTTTQYTSKKDCIKQNKMNTSATRYIPEKV